MPVVLTCTSCRYSNTVFWRDEPLIRLLVTTPSTVNAFSAPLAPFTWKPPSISPELTDGAVMASDWKLRPFGIRSISSAVTLCDTRVLRESIAGRASACTWTTSVMSPTLSCASTLSVLPRLTATSSIDTLAKPLSSTTIE